jgi:hypothetical protein
VVDAHFDERPRKCVICNGYHYWEDEGYDCD